MNIDHCNTTLSSDRAAFEAHMREGNGVLSRRQTTGYVAHSDNDHYRTWQAALRYARATEMGFTQVVPAKAPMDLNSSVPLD